MVKQSVLQKSIKFVAKDILFDLVYWLYWWYTQGLKKAFISMLDLIATGNKELGLMIWVKNLFKPMFGQYDWQGRLISVFMRFFMIIIRFIIFLFWVFIALVKFLLWILIPIFIVGQVLFNLNLVSF
ncbi:hypothetical protein HN958_01580 [Candidatus Falkowbacteria bacterium]|nr:hypothetical protein [Candidatus Falkowbacteria bacterium]